jgi:hypothetical protein
LSYSEFRIANCEGVLPKSELLLKRGGKRFGEGSISIFACDFAACFKVTTETVVLRSFPQPRSPGCCFGEHAHETRNTQYTGLLPKSLIHGKDGWVVWRCRPDKAEGVEHRQDGKICHRRSKLVRDVD